jgi:hypothetical protein
MVISEFLPNPVGKDAEGEWLKLLNNEEKEINLSGWRLKDASGKTYTFGNQKISAGESLILDYKTTKISLNNDGETLFLFDAGGNLIDKIEYIGSAPEGKIFTKKESALAIQDAPNQTGQLQQLEQIQQPPGFQYIFLGLGVALFLALASILIIKRLKNE